MRLVMLLMVIRLCRFRLRVRLIFLRRLLFVLLVILLIVRLRVMRMGSGLVILLVRRLLILRLVRLF